jgi:cytochrome c oxidase subunit 3
LSTIVPAPLLDEPTPAPAARLGEGGAPPRSRPGDGGSDGDGGLLGDAPRFGLWLFLGTASMLFVGFTSAYILRRASADWQPLAAPRALWASTAFLFLSSLALEHARVRLRALDLTAATRSLAATGVLGCAFVAAQVAAWRALAAAGVFLSSNPHSSFFYLLTGVHIVHVLAGLVWYVAALRRVRRMDFVPGRDPLRLFATYWHFLAVLWGYLLFLLFVY